MNIGLIPLDERPVNTRLPQMIGAIGGAQVHLPPAEALPRFRQSADPVALRAWLEQSAPTFDALVVSFETLGYGGLISSRISDEGAGEILQRLAFLSQLKRTYPRLKLYGFSVITRISRHDDATEEPHYWAQYGSRIFRFSQAQHRFELGQDTGTELESLRAEIPVEHLADFLKRRARNFAVNQAGLRLLADGTLDWHVITSDDTSQYGLGSKDKALLAQMAQMMQVTPRLLMYAGADEVASVLVARLLNDMHQRRPSYEVRYIVPDGASVIAPFEDVPVEQTVARQIEAVGGRIVEDGGDIVLVVNPPVHAEAEWVEDYPDETSARERLRYYEHAIAKGWEWLQAGRQVALADVAYANGASHALLNRLNEALFLLDLCAFGAWNTAGNTLGTVIAQASMSLLAHTPSAQAANRRLVAHRLIEDWGYQTLARTHTRDWLEARSGVRDVGLVDAEDARAYIADELDKFVAWAGLPYQVTEVRLPWQRTFEVDFDLQALEAEA